MNYAMKYMKSVAAIGLAASLLGLSACRKEDILDREKLESDLENIAVVAARIEAAAQAVETQQGAIAAERKALLAKIESLQSKTAEVGENIRSLGAAVDSSNAASAALRAELLSLEEQITAATGWRPAGGEGGAGKPKSLLARIALVLLIVSVVVFLVLRLRDRDSGGDETAEIALSAPESVSEETPREEQNEFGEIRFFGAAKSERKSPGASGDDQAPTGSA
jgi:hypothetical protein